MASLESFIEHYGYVVVLVGTILEGETILILAGFAAHRGYLSLPWVMLVAFVGALTGDQFWFYIGWRKGWPYVTSRPRWAHRAQRVQAPLARYGWVVVLGFRFVYGLRTITPLVLGASGYSRRRFALLNAAGAAIWSVVIASVGYAFGHATELLIQDVKRYERWALGLVIVAGIVGWLWHRFKGRPPHGDSGPDRSRRCE